jgi:hypothetical protein
MASSRLIKFIISGSMLLTSMTALSHDAGSDAANQIIEYRQSVYHVIGWNVSPMHAMVDGKKAYDATAFTKHANRVAALAPMLLEGFPAGSYIKGKTEAKENVWTQRAEFEALLKKFETRSTTLATVSQSGDLTKIKPAYTELVQVCKDCHEKFKEKDRG